MLDGRHTGTGGGNHVVLGGPTPADSPFLRRPDLLRSLVALLAQPPVAVVPVLGPVHRPDQPGARGSTRPATTASTSWRSRSARSPTAAAAPPWLVDRIFRNLLVDVTGNTHRAEFCIDKLYSPDSRQRPAGPGRAARLRDAAARADEPGAAAAAARPGRAVLGGRPYRPRWCAGAPSCTTASCCRTSSSRTSSDVLDELQRAGYAVPSRVVRAALRVPLPADRRRSRRDGVELELRQAIEPWHVLGEEATGGGTARYVDSSVERLQVKVQGLTDGAARRHLQRPARAAASDRDATASSSPACATAPGSRRRACTRPSPCTRPLVFDLVDTWTERSLGGCTYHVVHPGGRRLRDVPGQRQRGRGPAACALLPVRPHAGHDGGAAAGAAPRLPADARPAAPAAERGSVKPDRPPAVPGLWDESRRCHHGTRTGSCPPCRLTDRVVPMQPLTDRSRATSPDGPGRPSPAAGSGTATRRWAARTTS